MRLICPNCGAQYEVPDDVIPAEGRDVQCSNCGDTWFQAHPDAVQAKEPVAEPIQTTAEPEPVEEEDALQDTFEEVEPPEVQFDTPEDGEPDFGGEDWDLDDDLEDDPEEGDDEDHWQDAVAATDDPVTDEPSPAQDEQDFAKRTDDEHREEEDDTPPPTPQRRSLAPAVADVLREEAEHEARVRAEEQETLETQAELGLAAPASDASKRAHEARDRMRKLRGLPEADDAPEPAQQTEIRDSRRDLLPDIEETNSTLRHTGDTARQVDADTPQTSDASRGRGFRLGFVLVILAAAAAVYVYSSHDQLAASYPQYAPQIDGFVDGANNARVWLDTKVTSLFIWLNELAGGTSEG
ncbi:zinc-ribbon domain-containing protein [Shimia haliotis]|uniref:MJ0042 family finger-like domain-containing protein n=1 Tax=Shimia haliotis TaxID=1280847 RepID=A0A1I4CR92_9RHOB|nr:zinc-ribbon domain-containing protein [Shimia haliotis]SFK83778.1 MJ0042 family finger-like domain-containing protein [Shimia haliotis]